MYHNLKAFARANREEGMSREQMRGVEVIHTGKHDRTAVDDTVVEGRRRWIEEEFATLEEARVRCGGEAATRIMTDETLVTIPDQELRQGITDGATQHRIRDRVLREMGIRSGFQMSWERRGERWMACHNIKTRFTGKNIRYCSEYIAGPNEDYSAVQIVRWREGFFEPRGGDSDVRTIDYHQSFPEDVAFLYLTTEGTWRVFVRGEERVAGHLAHAVSKK
jgi:hypothetical protein